MTFDPGSPLSVLEMVIGGCGSRGSGVWGVWGPGNENFWGGAWGSREGNFAGVERGRGGMGDQERGGGGGLGEGTGSENWLMRTLGQQSDMLIGFSTSIQGVRSEEAWSGVWSE